MLNRVFLVEINKLKPKRSKYKLINYQLDYLDYCLNNLLELHFFKSKINKDKKWQANYRESVVRTYLFRDLVLDGKLLDNESDIKKTKLRPYFTKKNGPLIHKRIVA